MRVVINAGITFRVHLWDAELLYTLTLFESGANRAALLLSPPSPTFSLAAIFAINPKADSRSKSVTNTIPFAAKIIG